MWHRTRLTEALALRFQIIQAPMAGGPTTPALVAAVSNAGGLGTLATGYVTPEAVQQAIQGVRALTDRPFGANLFVPEPVTATPEALALAEALIAPYRAELGLPPASPPAFVEPFDALVEVLLAERVPVVSFAFGLLAPAQMQAFRRQGAILMGTATTVEEARLLEAAGVDFIVAQGAEAGGHRGTFLGPAEAALIGTMALVPQVVDAVRTPVVAAGGLMDGRGLVAALALGAAGVQMGTAFLLSPESGTSAPHRAAIMASTDASTHVTRAVSGKAVRAIANRLTRELAPHADALPAYPIQNALTRELRQAATRQGRPDLMGMWAGQASRLAEAEGAAALLGKWAQEAERVIAAFRSSES